MMQPRTPILLVAARALCAALPVGAQAADDKLSALTVAGATTAYTCDTEAFGMDFTPFKKTDGMIRLALSAKSDGAPAVEGPNAPAGSWTVALAGQDSKTAGSHVASIATLVAQTCANGCPYTLSPKGEAMLWAPEPKSLDKLGDKETLTIAVLKSEPLSVSVSTFRGRDIVALEKGPCRKAELPSP
jgi:hypothetical protein